MTQYALLAASFATPRGVAHGGRASDAFHVIVPSLPGYAFCDEPFGYEWLLGGHIEDETPEEMQRRYTAQSATASTIDGGGSNVGRQEAQSSLDRVHLAAQPQWEENSMQYMFLVSSAEDNEGPPPARLMEEMQKLSQRAIANGTMVLNGGLMPTSQAMRLRLKGGKSILTDGPFAETKEVIGGFAIMQFPTRQAAIESMKEFMELHRLYADGWEGVCEMRPIAAMSDVASCAA